MSSPLRPSPQDLLLGIAGTYLRNVRRANGACHRCGGWANGTFSTCFVCGHTSPSSHPDAAGFLTYAADGTTAGTLMYGYKGGHPALEQTNAVRLLLHVGLQHARCAEKIVGASLTHWAVVPSTRGRASHPLRDLALRDPRVVWTEDTLAHVPGVRPIRQTVQPDLFVSGGSLSARSHVLLLDDTWTSGNKPLSATAALRAAGAQYVSLLSLARWLSFDFMHLPSPPAGLQVALASQRVFDVGVCPFTGGACP